MSLIESDFEYTDQLRRRFDRDGYLIFPNFLTTEGLARCQRECDALLGAPPREPPSGDDYFRPRA